MNLNIKKFFVILLFSVVLFATVSATWAEDLDNNLNYLSNDNLDEDINIVCDDEDLENDEIEQVNEDKSFNDIQTLIDNANENDTITLNRTYNSAGKAIVINKTLTIDGNNATLNGGFKSRILEVYSPNCIIKNINFIKGNPYGDNTKGGAILFNEIAYVYNCTFINNTAVYGGTVYGAYIFNSIFIHNIATYGGAIAFSKVSNSTFKDNFAQNGADLFSGCAYNCIGDNEGNISYSGQNCDVGNYTYIIFVEDLSVYITEEAYIKAQLFDEYGNPLSNKSLNLSFCDKNFYETTDENGIAIFNCSNFTDEYNTLFGSIVFGENNLSNTANFILYVNRYASVTTVNNVKGNFSKTITISASVKDINGNPINSGYVLFTIGDAEFESEIIDGKASCKYYCEDVGKYSLTALFLGNSNYDVSYCNSTLTVDKLYTTLTVSTTGKAYKATKLKVVLANCEVDIVPVTLTFSNGKKVTLKLNEGIGYYNIPYVPGKYNVTVSLNNVLFKANKVTKSFTISKASGAVITPSKLTTTYDSGKEFQIKVTHSGIVMVGVKLALKVYTGKKYQTVYVTTGSNGIAKYNASKLAVGTHKIIVSSAESTSYMTASKKTNYTVIKKATTIVSAPKVTNKYGTKSYFKVTIKNKATNKVVSGLYIYIKVYTGSKYTTYKVKTNSKGVASLNTKSLKKGNHKVVISSANSNYSVSKSGYLIKIS